MAPRRSYHVPLASRRRGDDMPRLLSPMLAHAHAAMRALPHDSSRTRPRLAGHAAKLPPMPYFRTAHWSSAASSAAEGLFTCRKKRWPRGSEPPRATFTRRHDACLPVLAINARRYRGFAMYRLPLSMPPHSRARVAPPNFSPMCAGNLFAPRDAGDMATKKRELEAKADDRSPIMTPRLARIEAVRRPHRTLSCQRSRVIDVDDARRFEVLKPR